MSYHCIWTLLICLLYLLTIGEAKCVLNLTSVVVVRDSMICYQHGICECPTTTCARNLGRCSCDADRFEFDGTPSGSSADPNCSSTPATLYPTFVRVATQSLVAACLLGFLACIGGIIGLYKIGRLGANASTTSTIVFGLQFIAWAYATLVNPVELETSELSTAYYQLLTAIPEAMWLMGFSTLFLVWRTLWGSRLPTCCCCYRRGRLRRKGCCLSLWKCLSITPIAVVVGIAIFTVAILFSIWELQLAFFAISRLYLVVMCIALCVQICIASEARADIGGRKLIKISLLSVLLAFLQLILEIIRQFDSTSTAYESVIWWIGLRGLGLTRGLVVLVSTSPGVHNAITEDGQTLQQPYGPAVELQKRQQQQKAREKQKQEKEKERAMIAKRPTDPAARYAVDANTNGNDNGNGKTPSATTNNNNNNKSMRKRPSELAYEVDEDPLDENKKCDDPDESSSDDGEGDAGDDDPDSEIRGSSSSSDSDDDNKDNNDDNEFDDIGEHGNNDVDPGALELGDDNHRYVRGQSFHPLQELLSRPAIDVIAERNQPEAKMIASLRGEYDRKWSAIIDVEEAQRQAREEELRSAALGSAKPKRSDTVKKLDFSRIKDDAAAKSQKNLAQTGALSRHNSTNNFSRASSRYAIHHTGSKANLNLNSNNQSKPNLHHTHSTNNLNNNNPHSNHTSTNNNNNNNDVTILVNANNTTPNEIRIHSDPHHHSQHPPHSHHGGPPPSPPLTKLKPSSTPSSSSSIPTLARTGTRMLLAGAKAVAPNITPLPSASATGKCNFAISIGGHCPTRCQNFTARKDAPATCTCGHSILTHAVDEPELIVPPVPSISESIAHVNAVAASSSSSSISTPPPPTRLCSICDDKIASIRCAECDDLYCDICDVEFHAPAKMSTHQRKPIPGLSSSTTSTATRITLKSSSEDDKAPPPPPDDVHHPNHHVSSHPHGHPHVGGDENSPRVAAVPLCDNCEQLSAAVHCPTCTMNLCTANQCDNVLHRSERTRHHIRKPIPIPK